MKRNFNLEDKLKPDFNLESYLPGKQGLKKNENREINILDLFSGSGAWVKGWKNSTTYKANIDSVDIIKKPHINFYMDVRDFRTNKIYDIVYASPPCTHFSIMRNINKLKTTEQEFKEALELAQLAFDYAKKQNTFMLLKILIREK